MRKLFLVMLLTFSMPIFADGGEMAADTSMLNANMSKIATNLQIELSELLLNYKIPKNNKATLLIDHLNEAYNKDTSVIIIYDEKYETVGAYDGLKALERNINGSMDMQDLQEQFGIERIKIDKIDPREGHTAAWTTISYQMILLLTNEPQVLSITRDGLPAIPNAEEQPISDRD